MELRILSHTLNLPLPVPFGPFMASSRASARPTLPEMKESHVTLRDWELNEEQSAEFTDSKLGAGALSHAPLDSGHY